MTTSTQDTPLPAEVADGEAHETIVPPAAETVLTPFDLLGEPATDRGFITEAGTRIRARIVPISVTETRAPATGDVRIAPSGVSVSLTLAMLNDNLSVATDADGALLIGDVHEIVWSDAAMSNPAFDADTDLARILRQQAAVAETRVRNRAAVSTALAAWGAPAGWIAPSASVVISEPTIPASPANAAEQSS